MKNRVEIWTLDNSEPLEILNVKDMDEIRNKIITHEKELTNDEQKELWLKWVVTYSKLPIRLNSDLSFIESEIEKIYPKLVKHINEEIKKTVAFAPYKMLESFK